ncbi:MAG TPA: T9SS type A sorting domain-containing protein [Edaphocola sp.]|nr:T9SS type A sorting domain-containing protein [Edaphocola sp.]
MKLLNYLPLNYRILCSIILIFGLTPNVKAQAPYCTINYANSCSTWGTSQVVIGSFTHTTACNASTKYQDYTSQNIPVIAGVPTAVSLTTMGYTGVGMAADFNNDLDFVDLGEDLFLPSYNAASSTLIYTGFITVPANVPSGNYRLRIWSRLANAGGANNGIEPCGGYGYGRYFDYTLVVANSGSCTPPGNVNITTTPNSANISYTAPTIGNTPTNYIYELRSNNSLPASGPSGLISGNTTNLTNLNFSALSSASTYYFHIRTFCSVGDSSLWISYTFTTPMDTLTPVSLGQFNADVIANGVGTVLSSTNNDVDNANYCLIAANYQTTSSSALPTSASLPLNRIIQNGFRKYRLEDYSENNSLRQLVSTSNASVRLLAPKRAIKVYLLGISGSGISNFDAIVHFADGTTQTQAMSFPDWYATTGNIVVSGVGRINKTNNGIEAPGPKLFDSAVSITTLNQNKQIDSITIHRTGTQNGISNILAVSILPNINQTCALPGYLSIANANCFGGLLSWTGNSISTNYQISYGPLGSLADTGTIINIINGNIGANTHQFANTTSNTNLQFYVRADCGSNSYSDWVGPLEVQLPNTVITPTFTLSTNICIGDVPPILPLTSDNGVSGTWSPATVSNTTSGTYTFTPSASFPCALGYTTTINVNSIIIPSFTIASNLCSGATSPTLPTTSNNGITGTWFPTTINNTTSGSYLFTPNTSSSSCVDTSSINITILPISQTTVYDTVCSAELPYTWNNITVTAGGTNAATYISNAANGCDSIVTLNLNEIVNTSPIVLINANPSINVQEGQSVTFTTTLIDAVGSNPTFQWYKSGQSIPGATNSTWQGIAGIDFLNGEIIYAYGLDFNDCAAYQSVISNDLQMNVSVNVKNINIPNDFKLYPNPTSNLVRIEGLNNKTKIKVIDAIGRTLMTQESDKDEKTIINIHDLSTGMYIFLFQDSKGNSWMQKVNKL